jgi:hypothetical protein
MFNRRSKLFAVLGIALLALLPVQALHDGWRYWQLVSDGASADGLVTGLDRQRRGLKNWFGEPYDYVASYEFADADGRRHSGRQDVGPDRYAELTAAGARHAILVRYVRTHPDISAVSMPRMRDALRHVAILALIAAGLLVAGYVSSRRARHPRVGPRMAQRIDDYYERQGRGPKL